MSAIREFLECLYIIVAGTIGIFLVTFMFMLLKHQTDIPIRETLEYRSIFYKNQHYIIRQLELDSPCRDCHVTLQIVRDIIEYEKKKGTYK